MVEKQPAEAIGTLLLSSESVLPTGWWGWVGAGLEDRIAAVFAAEINNGRLKTRLVPTMADFDHGWFQPWPIPIMAAAGQQRR